jgi:hypothetical protein
VGKFTISTGELIDRLSICNVKVWKAEEAINSAKDEKTVAKYAIMVRSVNRERAELREAINERIDKRSRGTTKLNYALGRDK